MIHVFMNNLSPFFKTRKQLQRELVEAMARPSNLWTPFVRLSDANSDPAVGKIGIAQKVASGNGG